jgi:hypothetical protein
MQDRVLSTAIARKPIDVPPGLKTALIYAVVAPVFCAATVVADGDLIRISTRVLLVVLLIALVNDALSINV